MKTLKTRFSLSVTLFNFTLSAFAEQNFEEELNLSSSEVHQILWEQKVAAILNKESIQKMEQNLPEVTTQTNYDVNFYDI